MGTEQIFRSGASVYFVGIKGTGVCALAELMHNNGFKVSGSDTSEVFYTDKILKNLNIPYYEEFNAEHINKNIDIVIHSSAYNINVNAELIRAQELKIPVIKYTDALGLWSAKFNSGGICGVHGKTTTTAMCGVLARAAGLPAQILTGSASLDFGGSQILNLGNKYFIAETCEYQRHFLSFHPKRIILTSVETDHHDYFADYKDIRDAFADYCRLLPQGGQLVYCADDIGASEVVHIIRKEKRGIELIPYGFTASGDYGITSYNVENEMANFTISRFPGQFNVKIPGRHEALNATAAIALTALLVKEEFNRELTKEQLELMKTALENFKSTKRRSEIIGETGGILFMDDYGHHPTAIKTTLSGIKSFFPTRRLVVSFMPHTYSRTSALLYEFASAFNDADVLFLHKIYASAREKYNGQVDAMVLYDQTAAMRMDETYFVYEPDDAFEQLSEMLRYNDIFLTLGAGSNWSLGEKLFNYFKSERAGDS